MEEDSVLTPPVKPGDILKDQEIINLGKKNDGVIKHEGYILFVDPNPEGPGLNKEDIIDVEVTKVLPKFGIGKQIIGE
jgi:predicted RNA-binding protein with TRAM domain